MNGHGQSVQVRSAVGGREVLGLGALQGELPNQATQAYQYHAESQRNFMLVNKGRIIRQNLLRIQQLSETYNFQNDHILSGDSNK